MEELTSLNGRQVKRILELKQKKYRERYGLFLMEGIRSAEDALLQGFQNASLYVTRETAAEVRADAVIKRARVQGWRITFVTEAVMNKLSGTEHGQGMLAVLPIPKRELSECKPDADAKFVLLDAVQDPGNMGTILRTAAAAGISGVILTEGCTDPYAEKAVRSSMGSILRMPVYTHVTPEELDAFMKETGLPLLALTLEGGRPYREVSEIRGGIFAFGNEGAGISSDIVKRADEKLYVPMAGGVESLNVSVCAGIVLFHFKHGEK